MKRKIAMLILGILLIGVISASLLTYFGQITGSVEVKAPKFYLSCENSDISSKPYKLLINNDSTGECTRSFTDGSTNQWFVTDPLGVESFYPANYEIFLKVKNTHENETGQILVQLWVIDEDGHLKSPDPIDSELFSISPNSIWESSLILTGGELTLDDTDRIALKLTDGLHDITYQVLIKDGNNKIEVTAI
jgi:hypothetical protein